MSLYASAHFESLLVSITGERCIVDYVQRESQFVRNRLPDGEEEREPLRLDNALEQGFLHVLGLDSEAEFEQFLALALRLDEGEAATLAIASSRNGTLISDDRKALLIARELSVPTATTPDVLRRWSETSKLSGNTLQTALENIRIRARFEPDRNHPLSSWWRAAIENDK